MIQETPKRSPRPPPHLLFPPSPHPLPHPRGPRRVSTTAGGTHEAKRCPTIWPRRRILRGRGGGDSLWALQRTTIKCVIIVSIIITTTIIVIVVVAAVVAVVVIRIIIIVIIIIIIIIMDFPERRDIVSDLVSPMCLWPWWWLWL